jgi:hypothetical protein
VAVRRDFVDYLAWRRVLLDRDDVHPRHHDVVGACVLQIEHVVDHHSFFRLDHAVVRRFVRAEQELVFGAHRNVIRAVASQQTAEGVGRAVGNGHEGANQEDQELDCPQEQPRRG